MYHLGLRHRKSEYLRDRRRVSEDLRVCRRGTKSLGAV